MNHIFFIGIGGISMSALAKLMLNNNIKVSGSDQHNSKLLQKLQADGAKLYFGHKAENIDETVDLVVYTSAIRDDNEEFIKAKELGIEIQSRAVFLGNLMRKYKHSIAVSGTHGKTTTTGMLSSVLINSSLDPTIFLGGELNIINGNVKIGNGDLLLTEACEYKRNFLNFNPSISVILNISEDHLDYYKDINDINDAFVEFANKLPKDGMLVVNNLNKELFKELNSKLVSFGLDSSADIYASDIEYLPYPKFKVNYKDMKFEVQLSVFGEHNVLNALSVIAVSLELEIDTETIKKGLKQFTGTKRRYELRGIVDDISVIEDYAHHPDEIKTSLLTARSNTNGKVITIFQPHTYTRTRSLFEQFAKVFELSDEIIFVDIYAARELDTGEVSSEMLAEETKKYNKKSIYAKSFEVAATLALEKAKANDIIVVMGAGDVNEIVDILLRK
jgi:UDP-N-acetylmuramate--alanine ligase